MQGSLWSSSGLQTHGGDLSQVRTDRSALVRNDSRYQIRNLLQADTRLKRKAICMNLNVNPATERISLWLYNWIKCRERCACEPVCAHARVQGNAHSQAAHTSAGACLGSASMSQALQ